MGCHTWHYKKVERTLEEARKIWIDNTLKNIKSWECMCKNSNCKVRKVYIDWNQEFCNKQLLVLKRQLRVVKKGLCNLAVFNKQPEYSLYIEKKGFYVDCDDFHDSFRIGHYPDDTLFSYDECIDYIKKYEKEYNIEVKLNETDGVQWLKEFWDKYPDGLIRFG